MAGFSVTTKIITHNRVSNLSDTETEKGGEDSMAKAITDYLATVTNTKVIHSVQISHSDINTIAVIIHDT